MKQQNRSFAILISFVILAIGAALAYARYRVADNVEAVAIGVGSVVLALIVSSTIQVADQWDRAVILRLGKFRALKGPGIFFIVPVVDAIPYWIDTRVITTGFKAEKP
jgi:regulator of protease activity HflC (stomatin/prohibitin superfamily)